LEWLRKLLISIKVNILVSYDGQLVNVVLEPISVIVNYALKIAKKNWIDDLSKIGLQIGKLNDDLPSYRANPFAWFLISYIVLTTKESFIKFDKKNSMSRNYKFHNPRLCRGKRIVKWCLCFSIF
jgi:hypothetical protein